MIDSVKNEMMDECACCPDEGCTISRHAGIKAGLVIFGAGLLWFLAKLGLLPSGWFRPGLILPSLLIVGGVWLMYGLGYNLSVAVVVGFIALAGLAAETGIVMLAYLDEAFRRRRSEGRMRTMADLYEGIIEGAVLRVRPKLMTVGTTILGLLPVMVGSAHQSGSQVMQRIAAPMVGGLVSAAVLTLLVLPAIYMVWKGFGIRRELRASGSATRRCAAETASDGA